MSKCQECEKGFTLNNDEICVECLAGHVTCSIEDFASFVPDSCPMSMFEENGKCEMCPSSCSSCVSSDNCTTCRKGFFFFKNDCKQMCNFPCYLCQTNNNSLSSNCLANYKRENWKCEP